MIIFTVFSFNVFADTEKNIITGKQDLIVLGSVKDIEDGEITVTVDHVLGNSASELTGNDIKITEFSYSYCDYHVPSEFNSPTISDNVVLSIDKSNDKYKVKNGAYKVDSNEYESCKLIKHIDENSEECLKILAEIVCFIRSDGQVKKFTFTDDGSIYAAYPLALEQCVQIVDKDGNAVVTEEIKETPPAEQIVAETVEEEEKPDNRWIVSLIIFGAGALIGLLVQYVVLLKKSKKA